MKNEHNVGQGMRMTTRQFTDLQRRNDATSKQSAGAPSSANKLSANKLAENNAAPYSTQLLHSTREASNDDFACSEQTRTFRMTRFGAQEGSVEEILQQIEQEKNAGKTGKFSLFRSALLIGALLFVGYLFSGLMS